MPLLKIESRKRIVSYHSQKSRVEREMNIFIFRNLENRDQKEKLKYAFFEIKREISLSSLDFSLASETLVNAAAMSVTFCSSGKTEQNSVRAGGHCLRLASGRTTRSLEKLNSAWWANGHWMDWPDTSLCLGSGERLIIADESCL